MAIPDLPSLHLLGRDARSVLIIIEMRLLDGDFDTSWFPMKALIECRLQFGLSSCVADATHAVVTVAQTQSGRVLAWGAMIRW